MTALAGEGKKILVVVLSSLVRTMSISMESPFRTASPVCLQMVLDKLDQKLREGFRTHINLSCLFSKSQSMILLPS